MRTISTDPFRDVFISHPSRAPPQHLDTTATKPLKTIDVPNHPNLRFQNQRRIRPSSLAQSRILEKRFPPRQQNRRKIRAHPKRSPEEEKSEKPKKKSETKEEKSHIRLLVRLAFSDHEKLTYTRWLDRIPTEEPFKNAKHEIHNQNDPGYEKAQELFDSLD